MTPLQSEKDGFQGFSALDIVGSTDCCAWWCGQGYQWRHS